VGILAQTSTLTNLSSYTLLFTEYKPALARVEIRAKSGFYHQLIFGKTAIPVLTPDYKIRK
jgi:hypothetical protein